MKRRVVMIALLWLGAMAASSAQAKPAAEAPAPAQVERAAGELVARNYRADAPGAAVLVARGDTILFRGARGEADVATHAMLRPESVFRIGSVTKQFSAAGLLTLVEAGKVKLDDPLSKYVLGFPGGDQITVLQLLNHTSGVKSYTGILGYMDGPIRRDLTTAQLIDAFRDQPPDFPPGTKWSYSNSGYVLVGAVIEAASGKPWYAYLDETLFKPLGLQHTGYGHDPRFVAQMVHGYSDDGGKVVAMKPLSMTQPHAAGALLSTVDDLLKWNRALHEGRVLKSETYRQMITPAGAAAEGGISYGFGLIKDTVRGQEVLRHSGGIFGFVSHLSYMPGPDISVVILENSDSHTSSEPSEALARRLMALALGDPYPDMKEVPIDAAALREAEGVYRFDAETTRVLRVVDGKLTAQRGRAQRRVLTPIGRDDFLYDDGFNRLTLERDTGGKIVAMRFFANGDGDGVVGARTNEPLPTAPVGMQLPRAALERVAGTYANGDLKLKIFIDGDTLKAELAGQPPVGLRATSPTKFDVEETDATLEFSAGDGAATQVTMRQNGREIVLKRVP